MKMGIPMPVRVAVSLLLWTLALSWAAAAPYVILPSGKKMEGTRIRANATGEIILTTADGQQVTFVKGTKAFVDEPASYARAVQVMQQRQYDEAARLLKSVVDEYRFLEWDHRAMKLLGRVYVNKDDYKEAVRTYEDLIREVPESRKDGDVQIGYMQALQGAGDREKLTPLLDSTIATGPREAAAQAQVIRGNIELEEGDVESALFDFLRTTEFFRDVAEAQPEALYKAAVCMDDLRDERGADLRKRLTTEYPGSEYAKKLKSAK